MAAPVCWKSSPKTVTPALNPGKTEGGGWRSAGLRSKEEAKVVREIRLGKGKGERESRAFLTLPMPPSHNHSTLKLDVVAHASNSSTQEAEARRLLQIPDQPGLHNEFQAAWIMLVLIPTHL